MTYTTALHHAQRLHRMWIGSGSYDLARIHASMIQDHRYRSGKPQFAAVTREIKGQLVLLGKIRRVLEPNLVHEVKPCTAPKIELEDWL